MKSESKTRRLEGEQGEVPKFSCQDPWLGGRSPMPISPELTSSRLLVYQGVGRNVLQFQRLEHLLKHLLGSHQCIYTPETLVDEMKKGLKAQERKTLGLLAGDLFEKFILTKSNEPPAGSPGDGLHFHHLSMVITEEDHPKWKSQLQDLVEERNKLVHQSLLEWDLDTIEGCQAIVTQLEAQHQRIRVELDKIIRFYEDIDLMREFLMRQSQPGNDVGVHPG